ncbi:hypothetical protein MIND_01259800 [Mycena indigotica]|uniref:Uncharacterized protein n=1 Tax=Mycena indigotica TaxID=2126181 RepID=A0A8H6VTA0_9AGAR|nr:uncharacterized protein MIND_01259800 [Mycena indigotica]KAF7291166.1 hypothetical protein MIND_01259800 [Mycena indigotica]
MSSPAFNAAISHAVAFLIRPLLANSSSASTSFGKKTFSTTAITTAHVILTSAFATSPTSTYVLTPSSAPSPIKAAAEASGIAWADWFAALVNNATTDKVLLFFGHGYAKVRLGQGRVVDIWNLSRRFVSSTQPKVAITTSKTTTQLRAALLSAQLRVRGRTVPSQRRVPLPNAAVHRPSPLRFCSSSDEEDEDSDSEASDYDADSDFSSDEESISTPSTAPSSPPLSPVEPAFVFPPVKVEEKPKPAVYVPPARRAMMANRPAPKAPIFVAAPRPRASQNSNKPKTTAYIYTGGVTRVMTGGVMLGPRVVGARV